MEEGEEGEEREEEEEKDAAAAGYRIKNKNPTQSCGEKRCICNVRIDVWMYGCMEWMDVWIMDILWMRDRGIQ